MSHGNAWSRTTRTKSPVLISLHSHCTKEVPLNRSVRLVFCS